MATPAGFEPATPKVEASCSNPLSYGAEKVTDLRCGSLSVPSALFTAHAAPGLLIQARSYPNRPTTHYIN